MYAGPIEQIYKDMEVKVEQQLEETIIKAVRACDIGVDKEELIKALNYDRNQYKKGYKEGYEDGEEHSRWISCSERLPAKNITVIGTTRFDDIYKAELYDDCGVKKWYADGDFDVPIVAWMPLPPYKAERHTCGECQELGTVNCSETYREPTKHDDVCESFKAERSEEV